MEVTYYLVRGRKVFMLLLFKGDLYKGLDSLKHDFKVKWSVA